MFVDATHVKAAANSKKAKKIIVAKKTAKFYQDKLDDEINIDRESHGKKPLKKDESEQDKDDHDDDNPSAPATNTKGKKVSTTDEESGWFHKGEHKSVFALSLIHI